MTSRRTHRLAPQPRRPSRLLIGHLPALGALAALALVASGMWRAGQPRGALAWTALGLVTACCALALARRLRQARRGMAPAPWSDLGVGALLLGTAAALVQPWPGLAFPLLCGLLTALAAALDRRARQLACGFALALLFADGLRGPAGPVTLFAQALLLIGFAALPRLLPNIASARETSMARADEVRAQGEARARARRYRLIDAAGQPGVDQAADLSTWLQDTAREVAVGVGSVLELAETALNTHTCAAFLLTEDGASLCLDDCRSSSDLVRRDPIPSGEGILGAALKQRAAVRLSSASLQGINYYTGAVPPLRSALALPICEAHGERALRGVLVADRLDDLRPFSPADERVLGAVAGEILRAIEGGRLLTWFKQANEEKERLYSAIEELNRTTRALDALGVALDQARAMARLDVAALTLVRDERGKRFHQVVRATPAELEGRTFADNAGLVANVVRYGAALPERDLSQMDRPLVFDEEAPIKGLRALRIFPLVAGDRIVGTLVAGRQRGPRRFERETVRALEVLALQVAQSVLRADLFEQMEQLATTDGLTGLLNHRTFQARCDQALQLAQRYGKKLSLMLTDIDHFKRVNDTYGHPVGDLVLRGVARILRETARDTDIVARYGGEEFCAIMPETDAEGARAIAERVRKEIEAAAFETEQGALKVTLSLGIATYPENADKKQALIDLADQCLYFAKEHGRNRSVTAAELADAHQRQSASRSI